MKGDAPGPSSRQGERSGPTKPTTQGNTRLWRLCLEQPPVSLKHLEQYDGHEAMYRCVAITPEGFIQQLAVCYVARGYWFYVMGEIPAHKDPALIDAKLLATYGVDISKWSRMRRKRAGLANMQYLRHGRVFVLLATHGRHEFFEREGESVRDVRRAPIRFKGYSVSYRGGRVHVRVDRTPYLDLKASLLEEATKANGIDLLRRFRSIPFEPYAPVRRQLLSIWRAVNRARKVAGLQAIPVESIRLRRRIVCPFMPLGDSPALLPDRAEVLPGTTELLASQALLDIDGD